ncbi:MAG: 4-hydroxy-tetrahydrodipicolinate synthase [Firmicutes bacterium]|nr:4-hydroxy-tetrahydrodipicolinate synthase [Bacillota bacterium]
MKQTIFRGIATALATPMRENGEVDYDSFGRLIDWQIDSGVNALVACGTTGESATLREQEQQEVIAFTIRRAAGRVPVIAGTGTNSTEHAIEKTKFACAAGADGVLVVTPYYNKATQAGLIAHYRAIADASTVPVIAYNVPSRTGCNLLPETCAALAEHPRIAGVKEASGDITQILTTAALTHGRLDLYSGNDDQIVPVLSVGGIGCVSVLSNVLPREAVAICDRFFAGDTAGAAQLQRDTLPLVKALFSQVNPIPVKAALAAMGYGSEAGIRMPLTPMESAPKAKLLAELKKWGVLA